MKQNNNTEICGESNVLGRLIYQASLMLQNHADRVLRPFDLTLEQFHPMKVLSMANGPLTQREICEVVLKSPANMTRILDRLELKALISRRPNPEDRRAFLVELTPKGVELVGEVAGLFDKLSRDVLKGISAQDRKTAQHTLTCLIENIEKMTAGLEEAGK